MLRQERLNHGLETDLYYAQLYNQSPSHHGQCQRKTKCLLFRIVKGFFLVMRSVSAVKKAQRYIDRQRVSCSPWTAGRGRKGRLSSPGGGWRKVKKILRILFWVKAHFWLLDPKPSLWQ